jgi:hypothetical protein
MGWSRFFAGSHVLVIIQADAVRSGGIQAFAATNQQWGRRECETEGKDRYVQMSSFFLG